MTRSRTLGSMPDVLEADARDARPDKSVDDPETSILSSARTGDFSWRFVIWRLGIATGVSSEMATRDSQVNSGIEANEKQCIEIRPDARKEED